MRAGVLGVLAGGLILAPVPVSAHHAFAAEYDAAKPIQINGTVTKVEWMNPHARFYLAVKDYTGRVTNWECELGSPNVLMRQGWTRYSAKQGDRISVSGYRAKDGSNLVNARTVNTTDGKMLFAGTSADGPPQ